MSSPHLPDTRPAHPLVACVADLRAALDRARTANAWTMTPDELRAALPELTRAKAALAELELRVLVEADRGSVGDESGFTSTPLWWAHATGQTRPAAIGQLKLAQGLDTAHEPTRLGMAAGAVLPDQARVIVDAVDALPDDLDPALRLDAETHLVGLAAHHDARDLKVLGRRVLEVVAPEQAEAHELEALLDEERRAAATASFTLRPDGQGSVVGRFKIPVLAGQILAQHLDALAAPHRSPDVRVARPVRWGTAFVEYVETRSPDDTPSAGGLPATVVVTMTLEALLGAEQVATLDTGARISASQARRLACEAGIIPAVLGSRSTVLDLGRRTRLHTAPQRTALGLRDHGCAEQHCDWPPARCHAHHPLPWSRGGSTSVENGMLLCPRHHTLAHDARYQLKTGPHGKVTFSRRC